MKIKPEGRRFWISQRQGQRYHGDAMCPGLDRVRDCGDSPKSVLRRDIPPGLTPCLICKPPPPLTLA